jgi:hypothetical protein
MIVLFFFSISNTYAITEMVKLRQKAKEAYAFNLENNFNLDFCILVDFSIPSGKYRLFVWDFKLDTFINCGLCSEGSCNLPEGERFCNTPNSYCSSLGKYKIGIRSYSIWGINIHYKLHGLEKTNSNAYDRTIVLHSYEGVGDEEIYPAENVESLGCPMASNEVMRYLDGKLKNQKKNVLLWMFD